MAKRMEDLPVDPTGPQPDPAPVGEQAATAPPTQRDVAAPPTPQQKESVRGVAGRLARAPGRRPRPPRPPRRTRVVVRSIGPWAVFKFSLAFYFCVWLIVFLAMVIVYMLMSAVGAVDSIEKLLGYLFSTGQQSTAGPTPIEVNEGVVGFVTFLGGCVLTLAWSLVNVLGAFLYNLISDVLGGLEVTLAESHGGTGRPQTPVR